MNREQLIDTLLSRKYASVDTRVLLSHPSLTTLFYMGDKLRLEAMTDNELMSLLLSGQQDNNA